VRLCAEIRGQGRGQKCGKTGQSRALQRPIVCQTPGLFRNSRRDGDFGLKTRPYRATITDRGLHFVPDFSNFDIEKLTQAQLNGLMAGAVAIGTLYCFLGYRTLKFVIALTGFALAGSVAAAIALWLTRGNQTAALICLCLGGISGAYALFFLYKVGIFLMGLLGAWPVADHVFHGGGADDFGPLIVLGVCLVGGLMAMILEKPMMIFATAVLGAWMLSVCGVYFYAQGTDPIEPFRAALRDENQRLWVLAGWIVLTIIGLLSQFATNKGKGGGKKSAPAPAA
jgi:hypothetical protein